MRSLSRSVKATSTNAIAGWVFTAIVALSLFGIIMQEDEQDSPSERAETSPTNTPAIFDGLKKAEETRDALADEYTTNTEAEQAAANTRADRISDAIAAGGTLPEPDKNYSTTSTETAVAWVLDGDTLITSDNQTVRLIGIDTPEIGTCGAEEATETLRNLTEDQIITLVNPASVDDFDKYGRILRYVDVDGDDVANTLLENGLAVARYDYLDGYSWHPREERYRAVDEATLHVCGTEYENDPGHILTIAPPIPEPEGPAGLVDLPDDQANEPWNQPGPDLDCIEIGHQVHITGEDWHHLDSDGDGIGCESYPPW